MCSSKPPKPDPLIGQAAMSNAALAKEQAALGREQLAWEKDRAEKQDPLIAKIAQQQIDSADKNSARADEQWNIYKDLFQPVEAQMVKDANEFDSPERQARMAAEAGADVTKSYQGALDSNQRNMERMGVNPNSGKFQTINAAGLLSQAKDTAGAMNTARNNTVTQGMALRTGVAQFGRNMPNTGIAADSLALNGGNSAVGNFATGAGINNASNAAAQNWFGGAVGANSSAGNLGLGQYQGQLQAWNMQNQNTQNLISGIGQLAGTLGGAYMMKPPGARRGGMVHEKGVYRFTPRMGAGLSSLRRRNYASGGMIEGPGTGTSDSVPAQIDGGEPLQVSNGEAILNQEAVGLVGEDFIHRINAAGLGMSKRPQEGGY